MPRNQQQRRQNKRQKGQGPRQKKQPKRQPNPVTAPLDPAGVRRETRASTNIKFRPLERAIGAEKRASEQRTKQIGNWWQNYLDEVSGAQAASQTAYDQAAATSQGLIAQAGATDAAQTSALQAEAAKNAELRGAAPGTELAGREAAAGAQRNYLTAATGAKVAQEGAAQSTYLRDKRRIGVGQSIASRKEEQRRTRGFEKDRRETRKERGNYATEKRGELRDKERDYLIQRRAFPEAKAERAQQEREAQAAQRQDENASRRTAQNNVRSNRQDERASERAAKNEKGNSGAREGQRNANSTARSLFEERKWPSWSALERAVRKESEVSPSEARKAVARLKKKVAREQELEATPHGR